MGYQPEQSHVWCYHSGRHLLGAWLDRSGHDYAARLDRFRTLLIEPVYPSLIASWNEDGPA